jgi:hypothetical protein
VGRKIGTLEASDFRAVPGGKPALEAALIGVLQVEHLQRVADPTLRGAD